MIETPEGLEFRLTGPQSQFSNSEQKFVAMVSGFGAGKTTTGVIDLLTNMYTYPNMSWLWIEPTLGLVKDIFYNKIEEILTLQRVPYKINLSDNILHVQGYGTVFCRSMDRPARIVGFECGDAYLDEFDTESYPKAMEVWQKVIGRIRQNFPVEYIGGVERRRQNRVRVMTTPEGFRATYEIFVKNVNNMRIAAQEALENGDKERFEFLESNYLQYSVIHASTYSNERNLPETYIDSIRAAYPPELIDAYLMGNFVNLTSGQVYRQFDRKLNGTEVEAEKHETIHIGIDFNVMKMSAVAHVIRDSRAFAIREIYKRKDTPDMIDEINNLFAGHRIIVYPDATGNKRSSADSAALTDIRLLKDEGFELKVDRTNPRVRERVNSMNSMFVNGLGARRYLVNERFCPNYVECLEQQAYNSSGTPDKKHDFDHLPDAAGYFINKRFGINRGDLMESALTGW